jgi:16S rRNA (guanine1207-N2)-methyltransferase
MHNGKGVGPHGPNLMRSSRLDLALTTGAWVLPEHGDIAVYLPRIGDDLTALPKDRVVIVTGFKPDFDHFTALGYRHELAAPISSAIVFLPRAKLAAKAVLAEAASALIPQGQIAVDGQKTDGIESLIKELRGLGLALGEVVSKAHGKLTVFTPIDVLGPWAATDQIIEGDFITRPGVFSADGPDHGSRLLAEILPAKLPPRVADFGAGWGYLSRAILARDGLRELDIIEAEKAALACARQNIQDPRASFHWADVTNFRPSRLWDAVVMNPPFHAGRDADASIGIGFIKAAHRGLNPGGVLWLVANRQLPYPTVLKTLFRDVEEFGKDPSFRLIRAAVPLRAR